MHDIVIGESLAVAHTHSLAFAILSAVSRWRIYSAVSRSISSLPRVTYSLHAESCGPAIQHRPRASGPPLRSYMPWLHVTPGGAPAVSTSVEQRCATMHCQRTPRSYHRPSTRHFRRRVSVNTKGLFSTRANGGHGATNHVVYSAIQLEGYFILRNETERVEFVELVRD